MREIRIERNDAGQRLDRFLRKYLGKASLSRIYSAIRKDVKVNGSRVREDYKLAEGDTVALYMTDGEIDSFVQTKKRGTAKRQFSVIYEDEDLIIVSKPFGLLVHGDSSEKKDTLANQVVDYLIEKGDYVPRLEKSFTPSPVHRLDRNTTGLVVFGKNAEALRELTAMFREDGKVIKTYNTIVAGELTEPLMLQDRLVKDEANNRVRVVPLDSPEGKYIETIVRPVGGDRRYTIVEVDLITGRSHQIRAHLSHAGYPLIGDPKYGDRKVNASVYKVAGLSTQLLHAGEITFIDPGERLAGLKDKSFTDPLPPSWDAIQTELFGRKFI